MANTGISVVTSKHVSNHQKPEMQYLSIRVSSSIVASVHKSHLVREKCYRKIWKINANKNQTMLNQSYLCDSNNTTVNCNISNFL